MLLFIKAMLINRKVIKNMVRRRNFGMFLKQYIQQGKKCTTQEELVRQYGMKKELFITGSDQVWNREIIGGDNAYFLHFVSEKAVRIAYAASMGDKKAVNITEIAKLTGNFDAISIREKTYAAKLGMLLGKNVESTLDPTLLLPKNTYLKCEKEIRRINHQNYILAYNLEYSEKLVCSLNRLLDKEKDMIVVNISRFSLKGLYRHRVMNLPSVGPGEFLTCIKAAQCIVTDSFHGMAFSIIYHKKFWVFENQSGSLRLKQLIWELGLDSRFIFAGSTQMVDMEESIDYKSVERRLSQAVSRSSIFLEEILRKESAT